MFNIHFLHKYPLGTLVKYFLVTYLEVVLFLLLRNFHIVFPNCCINLYNHQLYTRALFSHIFANYLLSLNMCFMMCHCEFHFHLSDDIEHYFINLLVASTSSFVNSLILLSIFSSGCFLSCLNTTYISHINSPPPI